MSTHFAVDYVCLVGCVVILLSLDSCTIRSSMSTSTLRSSASRCPRSCPSDFQRPVAMCVHKELSRTCIPILHVTCVNVSHDALCRLHFSAIQCRLRSCTAHWIPLLFRALLIRWFIKPPTLKVFDIIAPRFCQIIFTKYSRQVSSWKHRLGFWFFKQWTGEQRMPYF